MQLIDLTRTLDADDLARMPEAARAAAAVLAPSIDPIRPDERGADAMCALFGCTCEDLPEGEGWGDGTLHFSSHLGTHVDAPLHDGSNCEGRPARSITDIGLGELDCDGVVLDLRERCVPGEGIAVDALREACDEVGVSIGPGTAVLLRTNQERFSIADPEVFIVQQLDNLAALPPSGFKVGFLPMKLAACSAAPARVVAFLE